jgi:endonuclease/exonuclease/phosphatase (EEP) superfamily protein YafD
MRMARFGFGVTVALLAGAVIGLVLGRFGSVWPSLDVLAQFSGHLIGLALAAGLALFVRWRPLVMTGLGVFITLAMHTLLAEARPGPGLLPATHQGRPLMKVIALNAWHHNRTPQAMAEWLTGEAADVVLLSEFGPNRIELLHRLSRAYPHRVGCPDDWGCAMMVLSRRPFTASGSSTGRGFGPLPLAWVRYGEGKDSLTVMAVHVLKPIDSVLVHNAQLDELVTTLAAAPGHVVVGGDFNDTTWTSSFSGFRSRSGLTQASGFLPSFPTGVKGLPQLSIDHIFASPVVGVVQAGAGPDVGSDHRPIIAALTVPAGVPWPELPRLESVASK